MDSRRSSVRLAGGVFHLRIIVLLLLFRKKHIALIFAGVAVCRIDRTADSRGATMEDSAPKRRKLDEAEETGRTWPLFHLNRVKGSGVDPRFTMRIQVSSRADRVDLVMNRYSMVSLGMMMMMIMMVMMTTTVFRLPLGATVSDAYNTGHLLV